MQRGGSTLHGHQMHQVDNVRSEESNERDDYSLWNTSMSSSGSSGSWTQERSLPPPPSECSELLIKPSSVPDTPAKSWDAEQSDSESTDEGVGEINMDTNQVDQLDLDSDSDPETESECTTEIFIPQPGRLRTMAGRGPSSKLLQVHNTARSPNNWRNEVIPSVSNDNICSAHLPVKQSLTSEDIATNIDSGISNETSNLHSQDGTVVQKRTLSVSSSSHYSSSYSCGSRGHIPSPTIGNKAKIDDIIIYMREAKISRVVRFLSLCYAILLLILGFIFPIFQLRNGISYTSAFQGFYIYLYGLSSFFLIYVYIGMARDSHDQQKQQKKDNLKVVSLSHAPTKVLNRYASPMVGSLFVRVAVVLFCIGSVIDNGLSFATVVAGNCRQNEVLSIIKPVTQITFMLLELYLIFNNIKAQTRRYPIVAKFGIMHLLATNICMWILSSVKEVTDGMVATGTRPDYLLKNVTKSVPETTSYKPVTVKEDNSNCNQETMLSKMMAQARPYTYPCTVQFCFLATCILYVMWRHIDADADTQCNDCKERTKIANLSATKTIDCSNTSRGLLTGVITLATVMGCLVAFFMLTSSDYYDVKATLIIHNYQIAMYLLMTIVVVVVILKLRSLDHNSCRLTTLEDIVLTCCVLMLFARDIVNIISGISHIDRLKGILVLATSLAELLQSIVQVSAIVMGLKLCLPDVEGSPVQSHRPGRECVTFLIVANTSLWILSIFGRVTGQGSDLELLLLGPLLWNVMISVMDPFVTFFHLFSASCFIDIWYNAYRLPSQLSADL